MLCILSLPQLTYGQSGTVTAGGNAAGSGGTISYSIGQTDYSSSSSAEGTVSQGLQQPYEISEVTSANQPSLDISVSLHPNPVKDYLYLIIPDKHWQYLEITLFDIIGRPILHEKLAGQTTILDMNEFIPGAYFLIIENEKKQIKSFKIIKP